MKNHVYKYTETEDVIFITNLKFRTFENEWLKIHESGVIVVKGSNGNGYSWDGCSPKIELFDLIIGTPDGRIELSTDKPLTYYASMLHDILYQFKEYIFVTRREADQLFYTILKMKKFFWADVYFYVVRLFGWIYGDWNYKKSFQYKVRVEKIVL